MIPHTKYYTIIIRNLKVFVNDIMCKICAKYVQYICFVIKNDKNVMVRVL